MASNPLILEAIALQKCVIATYNRSRFKLAPYILYTRHDELHVDAVAVARDGVAPREVKLGTFRLSGLSDVAPDDERFEAQPIFDASHEKYAGTKLFAIEGWPD